MSRSRKIELRSDDDQIVVGIGFGQSNSGKVTEWAMRCNTCPKPGWQAFTYKSKHKAREAMYDHFEGHLSDAYADKMQAVLSSAVKQGDLQDLESLTVPELAKMAAGLHIQGRSKMTKTQLIKAVGQASTPAGV
jgi:hypothetical protein